LETAVLDDINDIAATYDRSVEEEHARLETHQLEHDLTWRYLGGGLLVFARVAV
jgi:hypothetical protein